MIKMNLDALSGCVLRKALNASNVRMTYHNKHKDGSGNFGFTIIFKKDGVKDVGCGMTAPNDVWYSMHGYYNSIKQVYALHFGTYSSAGVRMPDDWTFRQVIEYCKRFIAENEGINKPEVVNFT
jgi:hypothetical protein